jgi:solute carrier family 6 amino acid transporter-like protein 5/7/9/14
MSESETKDKARLEIAEEDENPERGNWTGKLDFLLSCLGYAVGLGNVWRFPYLCFKHGGGAFLIPYVIMLLFIGIPAFLMELTLGQYSALGPVTVYSNLAPLFKGLGFANFMASCMVGLYYNMIIAWTIYYMFASFTSKLPWEDCGQEFNSDHCFSITDYANCTQWRNETGGSYIYHRGKCIHDPEELDSIISNDTYKEILYSCKHKKNILADPENVCSAIDRTESVDGIYINETYCEEYKKGVTPLPETLFDIPFGIRKTAAQEYLEINVLGESDGIENMGSPQWWLVLCLMAAWIVIFLCLIKGIKSSGRVVYFTATFPYVILVILLIRAVTLPGAYDGIKFYMVPDWSRLSDIKVWEGAAVQIFFSLSVAGGGLVTLASYNKFHNNVVRDTMIVCFGNCLTSVFAGFAIFSILGFLAKELGVDVKDVVKGGTGLAFIAYPDLVTRLPISPLWAILFFAMLFTLGLDSQFAIIETVLTGVLDFAPKLRPKKTMIVGIVCTIGCLKNK